MSPNQQESSPDSGLGSSLCPSLINSVILMVTLYQRTQVSHFPLAGLLRVEQLRKHIGCSLTGRRGDR